jgi:hypothetical protein
MTDPADDQVELLEVDCGPADDMGEWIPPPDMENQARFFNGADQWGEEDQGTPTPNDGVILSGLVGDTAIPQAFVKRKTQKSRAITLLDARARVP